MGWTVGQTDTMSTEPDKTPAAASNDDMRAKYQEALAKKQGKSAGGSVNQSKSGKSGVESAPGHSSKMFRRKSG